MPSAQSNQDIERLLKELESPDEGTRLNAVKGVGGLAQREPRLVHALEHIITFDPSTQVADAAAAVLAAPPVEPVAPGAGVSEEWQSQISTGTQDEIGKLLQQLTSPEAKHRERIVRMLAAMGSQDARVIAALEDLAAHDPVRYVSEAASSALQKHGRSAPARQVPFAPQGSLGNLYVVIIVAIATLVGASLVYAGAAMLRHPPSPGCASCDAWGFWLGWCTIIPGVLILLLPLGVLVRFLIKRIK